MSPRQCPPGVLCIENITLTIVIIISLCVFLFLYYKQGYGYGYGHGHGHSRGNPPIVINNLPPPPLLPMLPDDVFSNPYQPPLQQPDGPFFPPSIGRRRMMPINVPTQGTGFFPGGGGGAFQQVGILTRLGGIEMILPLMGCLVLSNRDKWNFYTMSDSNNMVKLPIIVNGRGCMEEYGCDSLSSGDKVKVEGYHDLFKVTMYGNQGMRYLPF